MVVLMVIHMNSLKLSTLDIFTLRKIDERNLEKSNFWPNFDRLLFIETQGIDADFFYQDLGHTRNFIIINIYKK